MRELASGLRFPEGPIALPDGDVLVVEMARGTLSRVSASTGDVSVVADLGGGPNGAAFGPDGAVYVCNNGGCFDIQESMGMTFPGSPPPPSYPGHGSIQRVELETGTFEELYTACGEHPLRAPNDIVFDIAGGFWFTDHGVRLDRTSDRTAVYYATPDGTSITEAVFPLDGPNGIGLSPTGDRLYVAETFTGRVWSWGVTAPGAVAEESPLAPHGSLLAGLPGLQLLDSLAVDGEGWVNIATLVNGGITSISPDGAEIVHTEFPDLLTTNICFGGPELRTAYITLSTTGRLVSVDWPRPGLALPFAPGR